MGNFTPDNIHEVIEFAINKTTQYSECLENLPTDQILKHNLNINMENIDMFNY